jgi:hypothetical protein
MLAARMRETGNLARPRQACSTRRDRRVEHVFVASVATKATAGAGVVACWTYLWRVPLMAPSGNRVVWTLM